MTLLIHNYYKPKKAEMINILRNSTAKKIIKKKTVDIMNLTIVSCRLKEIDILPALKVRRFWVQTTVAVSYRLTLSRPTDNALPVSTILPKSRPQR
ncbi:MAG TPA: hypothetical protein VK184_08440, partial [Nostocaceae cyanobacterium]|nr:hypothetical protein [Nostocaceae cyanobacterium]